MSLSRVLDRNVLHIVSADPRKNNRGFRVRGEVRRWEARGRSGEKGLPADGNLNGTSLSIQSLTAEVNTGFRAEGWGKRLSAVSGGAITVLVMLCSVVPPDEITNVWLFEGKLAAGTLAVVVSAWLVYRRRKQSPLLPSDSPGSRA